MRDEPRPTVDDAMPDHGRHTLAAQALERVVQGVGL
jgi:hypothetical protein